MLASQPGTSCPKCGAESECIDWCEIDIGVGVQTFNHKYQCPTHGCFAFVYDVESLSGRTAWRDDHIDESKERASRLDDV